jgi:hypothetical protein
MVIAALKIRIGERLEQRDPALVNRREHCYGSVDGKMAVCEASPCGLVVWLYGWPVFGEGKLGAHVRVGMAIRDVMDELANRPTAFAIRRVELRMIKSAEGCLKSAREQAQGGDVPGPDSRI